MTTWDKMFLPESKVTLTETYLNDVNKKFKPWHKLNKKSLFKVTKRYDIKYGYLIEIICLEKGFKDLILTCQAYDIIEVI